MSTLKTKLTEFLGIKYPIIQAGMGPFSNNDLCVATANAGVLGVLPARAVSGRGGRYTVYTPPLKEVRSAD